MQSHLNPLANDLLKASAGVLSTRRTEWELTGDPGPGYPRPYRWVTESESGIRDLANHLSTSQGGRPPALSGAKLRRRTIIETVWEEVEW